MVLLFICGCAFWQLYTNEQRCSSINIIITAYEAKLRNTNKQVLLLKLTFICLPTLSVGRYAHKHTPTYEYTHALMLLWPQTGQAFCFRLWNHRNEEMSELLRRAKQKKEIKGLCLCLKVMSKHMFYRWMHVVSILWRNRGNSNRKMRGTKTVTDKI